MNVKEVLINNAENYPKKLALIFKDEPINFLELKERAFKLANFLLGLNLKKEDKVAIYLPNCPEYIFSYLAIFSAGLVAVPLDFLFTENELISCLGHAEVKTLITQPKEDLDLEKIKKEVPSLEKIIFPEDLKEIFKTGDVSSPMVEILDSDHSLIVYSSGTTGRPKGILWNYRHLDSGPMTLKYCVEINENYTLLCALPLSHGGGLVYLQLMLTSGATLVLMERFLPLEFLKNIEKYKVNAFFLVPSMYYTLLQLKELENFDLCSLKWINCFGAAASVDALRRFHQVCPQAVFYNGWGMMETAPPNVILPTGSDKIESIGKPVPWFSVKIVDENGKELKPNEVGELIVKGWPVMEGYYKDPELTKEVIRDGWLHTQDLAKIDEEGLIYILGRVSERIKVGGLLVYASEVESVILRHSAVKEVAVVPAPDKLRGEVPFAFVVLKDGFSLSEDELRSFCRKNLAHFKLPHEFKFITELPKTRTGKIDKGKLKQMVFLKDE